MRKALLATASGAALLAAGPALAADKVTVGISGYMEQWLGGASIDKTMKGMVDGEDARVSDNSEEGGVSQQSDTEFHVTGKLEADNGLTFSVKIEVEGNSSSSHIDESQATVSGGFGQIVIGSEDEASSIMHYGHQDVGIGLNAGDLGNWILTSQAGSLDTQGWHGDTQKISYYTPRLSGVQFGVSYIPDTTREDKNGAPANNDHDAVSVGLNVMHALGDMTVGASAGYYTASQTLTKEKNNTEEIAKTVPSVTGLVKGTEIELVDVEAGATKIDEYTFTNFGLHLGFGAFGFNAAYAMEEGGQYKTEKDEDGNYVKDGSKDHEVYSVGAMYSDGPMAVSVGYMASEADNGAEASGAMLSANYTLAPGVESKTSLFAGEYDKGDGYVGTEGTGFVTGIKISF